MIRPVEIRAGLMALAIMIGAVTIAEVVNANGMGTMLAIILASIVGGILAGLAAASD